MTTTKRRICWPEPDATCLEGGCLYCNDYPFRAISTIKDYASRAGQVSNRAIGEKDALEAFNSGLLRRWPGVDQK